MVQPRADLNLSPELQLPLAVVTSATGIVGQRGTGKTSTGVVLVEEAARAGAHFAVIDPTGAWYGLRSNDAGDGPGIECLVLGGENGDLPLDAASGRTVAELIVEQRISVVLDLSLLEHADQVRLVADVADGLYHLNREPLLLVIDEAHMFAPQTRFEPGDHAARCLGAIVRVVTLGRRKGLGTVLISQRPAAVSKSVLEQAEILIAHRLMGANDLKAIKGWLDSAHRATADDLKALASLERGRALVHAPTLDIGGVFPIREKSTFDSSATPEIGAMAVAAPTARASVDLDALRDALAESIERAEQDDPEKLRDRIRQLEQQLAATNSAPTADGRTRAAREELDAIVKFLGIADGQYGLVSDEIQRRDTRSRLVESGLSKFQGELAVLAGDVADLANFGPTTSDVPAEVPPPAAGGPPAARVIGTGMPGEAKADVEVQPLKAGARRMLDTLESYRAVSPQGLRRDHLGTLALVSAGGTFSQYLSALRARGYVEENDGIVTITADGHLAASRPAAPPFTPDQVAALYEGRLKAGERRMLSVVMRAPEGLTRAELGRVANVSAGGTFSQYLGKLRRLGLVSERARRVIPGEVLHLAEPEA